MSEYSLKELVLPKSEAIYPMSSGLSLTLLEMPPPTLIAQAKVMAVLMMAWSSLLLLYRCSNFSGLLLSLIASGMTLSAPAVNIPSIHAATARSSSTSS